MNLKELIFRKARKEVKNYQKKRNENFSEAEEELQRQRFYSVYEIIEEANLEDEYYIWLETEEE